MNDGVAHRVTTMGQIWFGSKLGGAISQQIDMLHQLPHLGLD